MKMQILVTAAFLGFTWLSSAHAEIDTARVEAIYGKLQEAIGALDTDYPELLIMDRVKNVAAYRRSDNRLIVEKKAIEVCYKNGSGGDAALAFLMGHELAHFYRQHNWGDGTYFLADAEVLDTHIQDETEADVYGVFIAYMAGYPTADLVPDLLDTLYKAYQLEKDLTGYPTLNERKEIATNHCEQVSHLLELFEMSNRLTAAGYYYASSKILDYLLTFLKHKTLYNNLGTVLLWQILQSEGMNTYRYPLELDAESPFRKAEHLNRSEALAQSIDYLEKSVRYDPSYHRAYINLCSAYLINSDFDKADHLLFAMDHIGTSQQTKAQLSMLKGILHAKNGRSDKADYYFEKSKDLYPAYSSFSNHNTRIMEDKPPEEPSKQQGSTTPEDQVGPVSPYELTVSDFIVVDKTDPLYPVQVGWEEEKYSSTYVFKQGDTKVCIQWVTEEGLHTARKIGIGSSFNEIFDAYIEADIQTRFDSKGFYMWLPAKSLLFYLNRNGLVEGWGLVVEQ